MGQHARRVEVVARGKPAGTLGGDLARWTWTRWSRRWTSLGSRLVVSGWRLVGLRHLLEVGEEISALRDRYLVALRRALSRVRGLLIGHRGRVAAQEASFEGHLRQDRSSPSVRGRLAMVRQGYPP